MYLHVREHLRLYCVRKKVIGQVGRRFVKIQLRRRSDLDGVDLFICRPTFLVLILDLIWYR